MAINQVQLTSLRLLKSASVGSFDGGLHGAVQDGSEVSSRGVPFALAEGLFAVWPVLGAGIRGSAERGRSTISAAPVGIRRHC